MFYYRRDFKNISMSVGRIHNTLRNCAQQLMDYAKEMEDDLNTKQRDAPMTSLSEVSFMINRRSTAKTYAPQRSSVASLKSIRESKKWTKHQ